jgi:hypothetical protein
MDMGLATARTVADTVTAFDTLGGRSSSYTDERAGQGNRQMIFPAYSLSAGIDSVLVTMHVPRFVSIDSPGWGGTGSSTWSIDPGKLGPSMLMM